MLTINNNRNFKEAGLNIVSKVLLLISTLN
jgi:hypothetical protein